MTGEPQQERQADGTFVASTREKSLANIIVTQMNTSLSSLAETQRLQGKAIRQQGQATLALAQCQECEREATERGMSDLANSVNNLSLQLLQGRPGAGGEAGKSSGPDNPTPAAIFGGGWLASQAAAEVARARENRNREVQEDLDMMEETRLPTTPPPKKKQKEVHRETPIMQSKGFGGARGQARAASSSIQMGETEAQDTQEAEGG